ncbi:MOLPALP family lipoprotein [Spiroplasma endosymbiont of Ammophila pubescens]|uniref:MOLPALP family lipoprotein n=1 Tax=Spiroplasma endosymbiont of Ammophila pubescens TaxID=3066315 RepID=UPI0032B15F4B
MAYISDQHKYDFNYLMYQFAQPMYLKDLPTQPAQQENLQEYNRYAELFNRYYGNAYLKSNLKTNLNLTNSFKPEQANKMISNVAQLGSQIFNILAKEGLPGLLTLIANGHLLNEFLSSTILKFASDILDQETLISFRNAFDDSIYQGMTYQESLTSGMIGLVNAVNELTGQLERFDYKNKTNLQATADNYTTALKTFGTTIVEIMQQKINFKFNLINNLTAISEVIRFSRIVLNYLQQFDANQTVTWNDIVRVRSASYQLDSKIDLQQIMRNLSQWLGDSTGKRLRTLMAILLQSSEHHQISPTIWKNLPFLVTEDLTPAGLSVFGKVIINIYQPLDLFETKGYTGNLVWDLINTMAAGETLNDMVTFLTNSLVEKNLPANLKPIITKIVDNPNAVNDLFLELYHGDILGDILTMLLPNSSVSKIKNLKMVFTEPLQNWLPNNELTNFIKHKSIVEVCKEITAAITEPTFINAKDVYHLFDQFLTPTTNQSWLLRDTLLNPDLFLEILGFKDKRIIDNSPLFYLNHILENIKGINGVFTTLTKYLTDFDKSQNVILQEMQKTIAKIDVTVLAQPMDNVFEYQINGKTITITVELHNNNKYFISKIIMN